MSRKARRAANRTPNGVLGPNWQKDETHTAILEAARRLLERDGTENCSLSKVAAEAEFATPAVFAYFTSKRELLTAIFAQDFAAFAQGLHRVLHPEEYAEQDAVAAQNTQAEEAVADPIQNAIADEQEAANQNLDFPLPLAALPQSAEPACAVVEEPAAMETVCQDEFAIGETVVLPFEASSSEETVAAVPERPRRLRRNPILPDAPAARTQDPAADQAMEHCAEAADAPRETPVAEPVGSTIEERLAKLEARRVDAWLERRLRVFEHSLADLEGRQQNVEKVSGDAKGLIDQTIADLKALVAESENRHRDLIKELRNTILQVSSRMEAVEAQQRAAAVMSYEPLQAVDEIKTEEPPSLEPPAPQQFSSGKGSHAEPHIDGDTFLSAARRAAKAAKPVPEQADLKSKLLGLVGAKGKKKLPRQTQYLLACSAMLLVMMGTAGFILSQTGSTADAAIFGRKDTSADARFVLADATKKKTSIEAVVPDRAQAEYLTGRGKPKSDEQAARWLVRAANEGNAVAQYRLGMLYRHGLGVEADPAQALRWYEASALQGNRKAMHNLGVANAEGLGVPQNYAEAARWFSQAANLGYLDSEFNLGVLYERGTGVPQSLLDAFKWYAIAAAQNDKESLARIDVLKSQLTADELTAAQQAAETFEPAPLNAAANQTPALPPQTVLAISETGTVSSQ
ncbi:MAG: SEL1-like repeat protein [Proteobacteria bacterium]|nr:SEL1-like repeat protein [Pseudomonadota bacterium]